MKFHRARFSPRSGFTLVELLVVVAIIGILASVTLYAVSAALNGAKRAKASVAASSIQTAVQNYYTEYGTYPVDPGAAVGVDTVYLSTDGAGWGHMTVALCGGIDPGNPAGGQVAGNPIPNSREITYLTPNKTDVDTTVVPAAIKNPFTGIAGETYFHMSLDTNYNNIIGDDPASAAPPDFAGAAGGAMVLPGGKAITGSVAVWANCDPSTNGATTNPKFWVRTY